MTDRAVARAHEAIRRATEDLGAGSEDSRSVLRAQPPFAGVREVTGQTAYSALAARELGAVEEPHRAALLRWVHELCQTRIAWDLVVDEADARSLPDPSLSARGAPGVPATYAEAFGALVEAPSPAAAASAYARLDALALPVAAVRNELAARRLEVARRLGLDHPWQLATGGAEGLTRLAALARATLDATEPLATELHKALRRRVDSGETNARAGGETAPLTIFDAVGRDAEEGWPARLGVRWLEDVFRALVQRPLGRGAVAPLPAALGGASFLRAADTWGRALRTEGTARSLPFALARDPHATEPAVVGAALATAMASAVFAKKKLGLTTRATDAHARRLARVLFVSLRARAAAVVLGAPGGADAIEEVTGRLFGAPLSTALGACFAHGGLAGISRRFGVSASVPANLLGALRGHELARSLVDRFDEDWFDNPRAGAHLASIGAGPVWYDEVPEPARATRVARAFEELLG